MNRTIRPIHALLLLSGIVISACSAPAPTGGGGSSQSSASNRSAASEQSREIAGYVNGESITIGQVQTQLGNEWSNFERVRYQLLRKGLQQLTAERLALQEAARRGITAGELLQIELTDKLELPTDEEIRSYHEANPDAAGRSHDQRREEIRRQLINQRGTALQDAFISELKSGAEIKILLEPPRFNIAVLPDEPSRGPADAPVTVVEYAGFECQYSRAMFPMTQRLMQEYSGKIRFVFRDYPLAVHTRAVPAAEAARCAQAQQKFWEYHDNLMATPGDFSQSDLTNRAKSVGLDSARFSTCLASQLQSGIIFQTYETGRALGVTGTPTFFINGRMIVGAKTYGELRDVVEEELGR